MNICYVLRNGENATSDLFHFSVEDNGKVSTLFFFLRLSLQLNRKVSKHAAKWHFNKMLKDTNWPRWRSNLPLYRHGIVWVTFRLVSSGGSVTHPLSRSLWEDASGFPHKILHPLLRVLVWWTPELWSSITLQLRVTLISLIDLGRGVL